MSSNLVKLLSQPFGDSQDIRYARKPWIYCLRCGKNTWRKTKGHGVGGHGWRYCSLACQKGRKQAA